MPDGECDVGADSKFGPSSFYIQFLIYPQIQYFPSKFPVGWRKINLMSSDGIKYKVMYLHEVPF